MKKILLTLLVSIFLIGLASAETQTLGIFKQNTSINLIQTCTNSTYSNLTRVILPNSTFSLNGQYGMIKSGNDYSYSYDNTSALGTYLVYGFCDENGVMVSWGYDLLVTRTGSEVTTAKAFINIGLIVILVVFLIGCVVLFMENNNLLARIGFFGLGYLLLIAITFISWNMASDFLVSAPFIASMFKILFYVLIIGLFPLIIGSFAYYMIMITKIKEIERLMTKGFSLDDAERRVKRK